MKNSVRCKIFSLIIIIIFFINSEYENLKAQTKPVLHITAGLVFPGSEFRGDLISKNTDEYIFINPEFIKNNYASSTGLSISGMLKFPVFKSSVFKGVITGAYTSFNTFRRSDFGTTRQNNIDIPVTYENGFSTSTFAFGFEASPFQEKLLNPFLNSSMSMNLHSLSLSRNESVEVIFSDAFRMGVLLNAGLNIKASNEYSISLSAGYHFSNLFFKSSNDSFDERITYSRENVPINDEEGSFYTNLSNPDIYPQLVSGSVKNINWLNISVGVNIMLGK